MRSLAGHRLVRRLLVWLMLAAALVFLFGEPAWANSLQQEFTPKSFEEFEWSPVVVGYTIGIAIFYGTLAVWLMFQGRRTA